MRTKLNNQPVDITFHSAPLQELLDIHQDVKDGGESSAKEKAKYFLLTSMATGRQELMDRYLKRARALGLELDELYELVEVVTVLLGEAGLVQGEHVIETYMANNF